MTYRAYEIHMVVVADRAFDDELFVDVLQSLFDVPFARVVAWANDPIISLDTKHTHEVFAAALDVVEQENRMVCAACHSPLTLDIEGTLIDRTGGDVCGRFGAESDAGPGHGPHVLPS